MKKMKHRKEVAIQNYGSQPITSSDVRTFHCLVSLLYICVQKSHGEFSTILVYSHYMAMELATGQGPGTGSIDFNILCIC